MRRQVSSLVERLRHACWFQIASIQALRPEALSIRMTSRRVSYSVSIGQGRIGSAILAAGFAAVAAFLAWPWQTQTYQPAVVAAIGINVLLSIVFMRQARKRVTITDDQVIVANWNRTLRVPILEVRRFSSGQPGRYSRISLKPAMECENGSQIRLDALIPILGTVSLDADIGAALRRLHNELNVRRAAAAETNQPGS
jgi:hypothetical protein